MPIPPRWGRGGESNRCCSHSEMLSRTSAGKQLVADNFLKHSEEVRDVGRSPRNILPSANQPIGESHIYI